MSAKYMALVRDMVSLVGIITGTFLRDRNSWKVDKQKK